MELDEVLRQRNMDRITRVSIVGMGALGILYGDFFARALGREQVTFLADRERVERYKKAFTYCNGRKWEFDIRAGDEEDPRGPAQLLIFAVKATALEGAVRSVAGQVGPDTIILSVLNGITSEAVIGEMLGMEHVLCCVAQGMDAVKLKDELTYSHIGKICIGITPGESQKADKLKAVTDLFDETGLPYTLEPDILRRLWCKWMLNVGVNQAVMVAEGTYGTVQKPGPARQMMKDAMAEVVALAQTEGIQVTEEDLDSYVALIDTLSPEGMPSMRQDGLAQRPSEVEFFAGTVIRRAEKAGLEVPVNRELYRRIKEMEDRYKSYTEAI